MHDNDHPSDSLIGSNSLADLAARIRAEHEAVSSALTESVRHAIAAGELLIEAKAGVPHGQWLPWLRDHCTMSERTAQLYMRCAKNRTAIEDQIRNGVADLSLNEAAAILMLSSDVRKLLDFAKQAEGLSGDALVDFCIANNVSVISDPDYNPFAGRSEAEQIEWLIFAQYLSYDSQAGRAGYAPQDAWSHVEYLLQRPFQNVAEWLGPEGDKWRSQCGTSRDMTKFRAGWAAFREQHRDDTFTDANARMEFLQRQCESDKAAGICRTPAGWRKKRRSGGKAVRP